jgi:hypothetical protein
LQAVKHGLLSNGCAARERVRLLLSLDIEKGNRAQKQYWRREPLEKRRDGLMESHDDLCLFYREIGSAAK